MVYYSVLLRDHNSEHIYIIQRWYYFSLLPGGGDVGLGRLAARRVRAKAGVGVQRAEVCGGRLLTGRLVAVAGERGVKIRLGSGGTHGVHTSVAVEDASVKEGDEGVLQRAGCAGAGVDAGVLGAGGVERGLALAGEAGDLLGEGVPGCLGGLGGAHTRSHGLDVLLRRLEAGAVRGLGVHVGEGGGQHGVAPGVEGLLERGLGSAAGGAGGGAAQASSPVVVAVDLGGSGGGLLDAASLGGHVNVGLGELATGVEAGVADVGEGGLGEGVGGQRAAAQVVGQRGQGGVGGRQLHQRRGGGGQGPHQPGGHYSPVSAECSAVVAAVGEADVGRAVGDVAGAGVVALHRGHTSQAQQNN